MDYNDVEFVAFLGMPLAPAVLLTTARIVAHKRSYKEWMPGYLMVGIVGRFIYTAFLNALPVQLFPPADVPGPTGGRGPALRGAEFVIGSWLGGIAGVVCVLITAAGPFIVLRLRRRPKCGLLVGHHEP